MKSFKLLIASVMLGASIIVVGCTDSDGVPTPPETRPFSVDLCPAGTWDGWCDVGE